MGTAFTRITVQGALQIAERTLDFAGRVTEKKNRIQGFIQGYLIGEKHGLTGERLFEFAEAWTEFVNIPYGKQNLPIELMKLPPGVFRDLGRLGTPSCPSRTALLHMSTNIWRETEGFREVSATKPTVLPQGCGWYRYGNGLTVSAGIYGGPRGGGYCAGYCRSYLEKMTREGDYAKNPDVPKLFVRWLRACPCLGGCGSSQIVGAEELNPLDLSRTVPVQMWKKGERAVEAIKRGEFKQAMVNIQ